MFKREQAKDTQTMKEPPKGKDGRPMPPPNGKRPPEPPKDKDGKPLPPPDGKKPPEPPEGTAAKQSAKKKAGNVSQD